MSGGIYLGRYLVTGDAADSPVRFWTGVSWSPDAKAGMRYKSLESATREARRALSIVTRLGGIRLVRVYSAYGTKEQSSWAHFIVPEKGGGS